jgi:hypothetical protein
MEGINMEMKEFIKENIGSYVFNNRGDRYKISYVDDVVPSSIIVGLESSDKFIKVELKCFLDLYEFSDESLKEKLKDNKLLDIFESKKNKLISNIENLIKENNQTINLKEFNLIVDKLLTNAKKIMFNDLRQIQKLSEIFFEIKENFETILESYNVGINLPIYTKINYDDFKFKEFVKRYKCLYGKNKNGIANILKLGKKNTLCIMLNDNALVCGAFIVEKKFQGYFSDELKLNYEGFIESDEEHKILLSDEEINKLDLSLDTTSKKIDKIKEDPSFILDKMMEVVSKDSIAVLKSIKEIYQDNI